MPQELALAVNNLSFSYPRGEGLALDKISFNLPEGQFLGICGPSGAGKSTLLLTLRGIIPNTMPGRFQGQIRVFGQDTKETSPAELTNTLGLVQQDAEAQIVGLTIEDDIAFGLENLLIERQEMRLRIKEALDRVGLPGLEKRGTQALSGGQKQRLAIAAALALKPKMLLLDEPTSELDPAGKADIFRILTQLQKRQQITIVIVEHEMDYLVEAADRLLALDEGRIVADAAPLQFLQNERVFGREAQLERRPELFHLSRRLEMAGHLPAQSLFSTVEEGAHILKDQWKLRAK